MKKKMISLLLTMGMVVSMFAACGQAAEEAAPAAEPAAEEAAPAAEGSADAAVAVDPVTIRFSSTYNQEETGGQVIQYFIDYLDKASNGAISVEVTWGGTLYDAVAELEGVSQGGTDMVALGHARHTASTGELLYLAFPDFAPGSPAAALEYFDYLMFENPETAALVEQEAASWNIKYLNVIAGGANAFCATYEFTDLASLASGSSKGLANAGGAGKFNAVGFNNIVTLTPPEIYDGLDRGMADCTQMALSPMVNGLRWQEVAGYWALDGTYTAGNPFSVNLDFWNSLSADQQALIQEAATATEEYSATMFDGTIEQDIATCEAATGNKFVEFSDADIATWWAACFDATAEETLAAAKGTDKYDGVVTMLKAAADKTGYSWTAPQ